MKKTKKDMYLAIKKVVSGDTELEAFVDAEIERLSKARPKKPTARQVENETIKTEILAIMDADTSYMIKDISDALDRDLSPQRVSALLTQLIESKLVTREYIKSKAYFTKI